MGEKADLGGGGGGGKQHITSLNQLQTHNNRYETEHEQMIYKKKTKKKNSKRD